MYYFRWILHIDFSKDFSKTMVYIYIYIKTFTHIYLNTFKCIYSSYNNSSDRSIIEKENNNNIFDRSTLRTSLSFFLSLSHLNYIFIIVVSLHCWVEPTKRASPSLCHPRRHIGKKRNRERMSLLNIFLFLYRFSLALISFCSYYYSL